MIQSLCGFFSCCILSAAGGHIIQTRLLQPQLNWTFFFVRIRKILFSIFTSIHVVVLSHCWMVMFSLQHSFIPACLWLQDHYNSQIWTFFTVQHRAIVVKSWPNVFSQFFPHWSLFNLDSPKRQFVPGMVQVMFVYFTCSRGVPTCWKGFLKYKLSYQAAQRNRSKERVHIKLNSKWQFSSITTHSTYST